MYLLVIGQERTENLEKCEGACFQPHSDRSPQRPPAICRDHRTASRINGRTKNGRNPPLSSAALALAFSSTRRSRYRYRQSLLCFQRGQPQFLLTDTLFQ